MAPSSQGKSPPINPVRFTEAAQIGIELCRALGAVHAVHEEGLLHRDVKAQNVMGDEKGRLVLGDFGTGRGVDGDGREEGPAPDVAGTPLYFAPEIFRREPATVQSDLYSLGVLLYHLVTGSFPVRGRSARQLRDTHDLGSSICWPRLAPSGRNRSSRSSAERWTPRPVAVTRALPRWTPL